jgi:cephalosporin-C deacetylase-like acetyl esterase
MKKTTSTLMLFFALFVGLSLHAQPTVQLVRVMVGMDHDNWTYKVGENAVFSVSVFRNGNLLKDVRIRYEIGPEKMPAVKKESLALKTGMTTIAGGTLLLPGFLRCSVIAEVDGKEYRGLATAGFDPEKIQPAVEVPADFVSFWDNAKTELAKIPLDAKMTLLPERCTEKVNVYHLNLQNYREGTRLYGILCVPKKEGKYPAMLLVPGAGVSAYAGDVRDAEKGIITLQIGIHGIPVTMDPSAYTDLAAGSLNGYWSYNLDDRDRYYYKRVFMGCIRANDFVVSLPQYDGVNLVVTGGSQGGALSIVTAALDPRVKWTALRYPAMADMTGYLKGRAGGWPHIFDATNPQNNTEAKIKTAAYYDVANFAKLVKIPSFFAMGYNDETCPPTSMFAAYNSIAGPKELKLFIETGHWTFPEENEAVTNWLMDKLGKK